MRKLLEFGIDVLLVALAAKGAMTLVDEFKKQKSIVSTKKRVPSKAWRHITYFLR